MSSKGDNNNENDEGSQRTQQSSKKSTKGANGPGTWNKKSLRGDITELGNKVYTYRHRNQGDWYIKTTEAIGDYVSREYNKEMWLLVMNKQETTQKEPSEPKDDKQTFTVEQYRTELKWYYDKTDQYEEYKAKVFVIIKGQCSLTTKNKVETMTGYKE